MLNYKTYRDKIKGCWLGKNIGGTFGAPLEGKSCMEFDRFYDFYLQDLTGEPVPNDDLDLQLVWLNGQHLYQDLRRFLHRMHQTKGQIEVFTRAEHSVMCPDNNIIFLHQLSCFYCNFSSAWYHPAYNTYTIRENNRAFCCRLPKLSCKYLVIQWKDKG